MKRILVLGVYYSSNLGDGVICECVATRLRNHFPDAQVCVEDLLDRQCFGTELETTLAAALKRSVKPRIRRILTQYFGVDKQFRNEQYRLKQSEKHLERLFYDNWDAVVIAGGQLYMDRYALFLEKIIHLCEERGTPIFLNACGVGPTYSRKIQSRLNKALNQSCVKLISSRDDYKKVEQLFLENTSKNVEETFDAALWTKEVYNIKKNDNTDVIGLGMMYTYSLSSKKMVRFWIRLIRQLERQHLPWKIFVNGSADDAAFARYVLSQMPELNQSPENYMMPVPRTPKELVSTIACFRSIISYRLHSHIIATSIGVPSIALVWDEKLAFFFEKIGYPERCVYIQKGYRDVLEKMKKAEKQGYDEDKIREQKEYADNLLYQSISKVLSSYQAH